MDATWWDLCCPIVIVSQRSLERNLENPDQVYCKDETAKILFFKCIKNAIFLRRSRLDWVQSTRIQALTR